MWMAGGMFIVNSIGCQLIRKADLKEEFVVLEINPRGKMFQFQQRSIFFLNFMP